jgi:hypothetical protein
MMLAWVRMSGETPSIDPSPIDIGPKKAGR